MATGVLGSAHSSGMVQHSEDFWVLELMDRKGTHVVEARGGIRSLKSPIMLGRLEAPLMP